MRRERVSLAKDERNCLVARENWEYKCPEAGMSWVCLRNQKKAGPYWEWDMFWRWR